MRPWIRQSLVLGVLCAAQQHADAQCELYALPGGGAQHRAGRSVAAAGDVDMDGHPDLIVGVHGNDAARVISGKNGALLHEFLGAAGDEFGMAVAGAGDLNGDGHTDLIVGARASDANGTDSGMVRLYSGLDGALLHTLTGAMPGAQYGHAVAGAGDVDADGFPDVLIGAPGDDFAGNDAGSAQVVSGFDGATLHTLHGAAADDRFGTSVAAAGDVDRDGFADVIVGAIGSDENGLDSGSARVFSGQSGALLHHLTGTGPGHLFGWSVAGGDLDADGAGDLVVGAPHDDTQGALAGSISVFSGASGAPLRVAYGALHDELGFAVAVVGDQDGDGSGDYAAGALGSDVGGANSGSVYVHSGADGSELDAHHGSARLGWFGASIAGAGDVNLDGFADLVIGAPQLDLGAPASGAAFVYLSQCPVPLAYCVAKVNSQGCLPRIAARGAASLSVGDNFVVEAVDVLNNKPGFLVWGPAQAAITLGGGTLCMSPFVRTFVQDSLGNPPPNDCSGTYAFHFSQDYMNLFGFTPGVTRHAQFYSRDGGFAPPDNIGLTDAIAFVVCP